MSPRRSRLDERTACVALCGCTLIFLLASASAFGRGEFWGGVSTFLVASICACGVFALLPRGDR